MLGTRTLTTLGVVTLKGATAAVSPTPTQRAVSRCSPTAAESGTRNVVVADPPLSPARFSSSLPSHAKTTAPSLASSARPGGHPAKPVATAVTLAPGGPLEGASSSPETVKTAGAGEAARSPAD